MVKMDAEASIRNQYPRTLSITSSLLSSSSPPAVRVQELCESRGGRPGLPVLTSLTVSVDVKQH